MEAKICKRTLTIETLVLLSTPFPVTKKLRKRTAHVSWFNIGMLQVSKHRRETNLTCGGLVTHVEASKFSFCTTISL